MGLLDNVRSFLWENLKDTAIGQLGPVERFIEPKDEEYQHYKRSRRTILYDINRFNEYLTEDRTKDDMLRWEYSLHEAERKLEFVRPNTAEDIEYRRRIGQEFASQLQEVAGNLDLRFHGTPIHFAEEIIKSGSISSSADRWDGYNQSTDGHGVFSVSDIDSLPRTVNWFLSVESHLQSQPCGCLFVLTPGDQTPEQRGQSIMNSVDLWNNPERLHSIVTTPENVERVQQWMTEMQMDPEKVHTFDDFVELAREEALKLEQKLEPHHENENLEPALDLYIDSESERIFKETGRNIRINIENKQTGDCVSLFIKQDGVVTMSYTCGTFYDKVILTETIKNVSPERFEDLKAFSENYAKHFFEIANKADDKIMHNDIKSLADKAMLLATYSTETQLKITQEQLIRDFKAKYLLQNQAPLYTDGKKIFVDVICTDNIENEAGKLEEIEFPVSLELFEINKNNPFDLESGLNRKHLEAFEKAIWEQVLHQETLETNINNQNIGDSEPDFDEPML